MALNAVALFRCLSGLAGLAWAATTACVDPGHLVTLSSEAVSSAELSSAKATVALEPPPPPPAPEADWRAAAAADDWSALAKAIDGLRPSARNEPGARHARAVAAAQLGDHQQALYLLEGLEILLPALHEDIIALRASCQLEVGPFPPAASYFASQPSPLAWLKSARAWQKSQAWAQALSQVERALAFPKLAHSAVVQARLLRAQIAERTGSLEQARGDFRWLAVSQANTEAEAAYQRLSPPGLTKTERLERARELAERGQLDAVKRELARLKRARGRSPARSEELRCLALAHYQSRNYGQAAALFDRASRLPGAYPVREQFLEAEAWSRSRRLTRARDIYRQIARRYPRSPAAEQADYLQARLAYGVGNWRAAERAYSEYLRRHQRKGDVRRVAASRHERALSLLAAGQATRARSDFAEQRRSGSRHASSSLLSHLEAVAGLESNSSVLKREAVLELEALVRDDPLSFAALASSARLARRGRTAPGAARLPAPGPSAELVVATPQPTATWDLPARPKLLAQLGLLSAAEAALHAEQPELLQRYSPRGGEALCQQYQSLNRGFRRYQLARSVVGTGTLSSLPTASSLWAWQCLYPQPYAAIVSELSSRYQLPTGLLHALMQKESAFHSDARSGVGAMGLMQLMPSTAQRLAGELGLPADPQKLWQGGHNLQLGAHYLSKLLGHFGGHVVLALASYNAGPAAVQRWLEGAGGMEADLWVARIPYRETRNYVQSVMSSWATYSYLAGGASAVPPLPLQLPTKLRLPKNLY